MSDGLHTLLTILVAALVTAALRFLPFLIFGKGRSTTPWIRYLSTVLPYAIIGMLVIYCLKDIDLTQSPHGIPELLGCLITSALHVWKRNTLLSIGLGTVSYMLMVQFLFI